MSTENWEGRRVATSERYAIGQPQVSRASEKKAYANETHARSRMATPSSEIQVHYGHLCTVRVTRFDIVESFGGSRAASVVFQVQANKTRAYRSFPIRIAYDPNWNPSTAVRAAWKQLTGQDVSPTGSGMGSGDPGSAPADPTAGQAATLAEIKEFVRSETQKLGVDLTLDVV